MKSARKQHSDYWITLTIFVLILFGLIMIYSVSKYYSLQITNEETDKFFLIKQLKWVGLGIIAWIVFQSIDYHFWQKKSASMLFLSLIFLSMPLLPIGKEGGLGARWFDLGFVSFQPSEIGKLTLIIYLSGWFASLGNDLNKIKRMFFPFMGIMIAVSFLMLLQKDLGTLAVMVFISAAIFLVSGAPIYQIFYAGGAAAFLLWLAIKIEPYRMERLMTFLNPESGELSSSYHIRNALIASGSGGMFGLGFGQSKQKYLYLPEAHTDSIFAIVSEELGFLRASIIIILFVFVGVRGYKIAASAPDPFSRLLATGITTWLISQMFINIGAMLSIFPLTGIPLPFISYGGSSLIILLSAVGILTNISKHQVKSFGGGR